MDRARDRRSDQEYTAQEVADLDRSARRALKPHLRCPYCEATAHFRSASRPSPGRRSKVAHFYALPHGDECDITRSYGDPWEDDDTDRTVAHWEQRNTTLIVRILTDQDEGSADNVSTGEPSESESRSRGGGDRTRSTNSVSRGPQKLLEQLVHWPSFKTSSLTLRMPDPNRTEMAVHDAFVRFEDANVERHTQRWHGFWGIVRPLRFWARGSCYYSNFGPADSDFRISIHESHVPEILRRYGLATIEDMAGHYLLLFDIARQSKSLRFTADVNSVNYIGILHAM